MVENPEDEEDNAVERNPESVRRGIELVRRLARSLPDTPGVYRMLGEKGDTLYVGKAKALRKRVITYANMERLPVRIQRMVALTCALEFVHTHTEVEALLLETNLIKELNPAYNVLMRDDKSFPYIHITGDHEFPLLAKHRGARKAKGDYYGPFAAAGAVNRTIVAMQKAFMLRNCTDSFFAQRTRPCLQYHIKRCTGPCVAMVTAKSYAGQVKDARAFLSGRSAEVQARLAKAMQEASERQDYEAAAFLRDRIRALTSIQTAQDINIRNMGDADVFGIFKKDGRSCVQVFFFRSGQNFGNRAYFPKHDPEESEGAILAALVAQFYANKPVPREIVVSHDMPERELLQSALATQRGADVTICLPQRGARQRLAEFAVQNAKNALAQEVIRNSSEQKLLRGVAELFGLDEPPARIEVYDNSHISGTNMVGAMIVAGPEGFRKSAYRKFNIKTAEASDDYGMMREVLQRRFKRLADDAERPDLVLIDGGQGQLNTVMEALGELGVADDVRVVSIAKGPDRNAGREKFFMSGREPFQLPIDDPVLHYLQRLRDEAHRFAIGTHRARRSKQISASPLDDVPGIGARRKKALLHHFGSGQEVTRAAVKDLEKVEGISRAMAQKIYNHFHEQEEKS
ncbi:MAG TPA: excinuclease ABC subunit UvrC [Alphaproteobacteria bacterium]|jgi:excinuclease ABC subunit C